MANGNGKILTAEQELELRRPIEDYVGKIQTKIDSLRVDGTDKVISLQSVIDTTKKDKSLTSGERQNRIAQAKSELEKAKAVEANNKGEIAKLISEAEAYIKAHFDSDYFQKVKESCVQEKAAAKERYQKKVEELQKEHQQNMSKLSDQQEIKDEKKSDRSHVVL